MPKVMTATARPGRLRAGPSDEREVNALRGHETRETESVADASASATTEQRITPSERLGSSNVSTARERGSSQNPMAVSPEPVDPDSVRRRNAFQTGSQELARFLRQNGEAFARAQEAAEGDASGFAQAWMEDFDHRAGEVFNSIPSEVRALFGNDFEALRAESFAEADSFERDRRILAVQQGIGGMRDDYVKLVGQEPARLDYAFQKMEEVIRASGLRPDLIEEEVLAARRAIFTSYRQARLAGPNPEALLREMEAGRFEGVVPPEEMEALVVQTTAEVGQRQRTALMERQVDADTRQRLELQRLRAGEGGDPRITPEKLREIFPGEVGERKAQHLESERTRAEVRVKTALMTAAEIEAAFGALEGVNDAKESTPDDTLVGGQGHETLAGGAESDGVAAREGADTLAGEASDAEPGADRQESDESAPAGRGVNPVKSPEELGIEDNRVSFEEDPFGHVQKHSDACREAGEIAEQATEFSEQVRLNERAIDLCLKQQERIRGTSEGSRVLSNEKVTATLAELEALPMLQRVDRLWNFMSRQGRHADRSLDELMQAGLWDQLGVAADLWNIGNHPAADELRLALSKGQDELFVEIGKLFGGDRKLGETVAGGIRNRVDGWSEEFRSILRANRQTRESEARFEAAYLVALQKFVSQGGGRIASASEIAQLAVDAVFPFQRLSDSDNVLIPFGPGNRPNPELKPRKVLSYLNWIQQNIFAEDLNISEVGLFADVGIVLDDEQLAGQYADNIRGFGSWRNTCDGVQLVDQVGNPVIRKDGSFVVATWEDIQAWDGETRSIPAVVLGLRARPPFGMSVR